MSDGIGTTGELEATFQRLRADRRCAFIPYITAGDPRPESTVEVMRLLADAGADLLELGIPFSDPLADGPTIQAASWRAVGKGVNVERVLSWTREFRRQFEIPVVLFSYLNPILHYGAERFVRAAKESGAAGLLLTDLPVGEDEEMEATLAAGGLDWVRLIAPTTPPRRAIRILQTAQGFIYYISRTGVTGERRSVPPGLAQELAALRRLTDLPIAVGFGIARPEQARAVAAMADGVVVGSALVRALADSGLGAARKLAEEIRTAIDAAR